MEPRPTLICIPDISGFTQFMSETDIELSSRVIPSLLNEVIYANTIDLKVSEIEGDAVLFFKHGELPSFKELIDQCKLFYTTFYKRLYELASIHRKNADAFKIPKVLGLKIILHYGEEVSSVAIGKNIKLIGEDVIIAHRLLKNDIKSDEYILISEELLAKYNENSIDENLDWDHFRESEIVYEHIGEINYSYISLVPLVK